MPELLVLAVLLAFAIVGILIYLSKRNTPRAAKPATDAPQPALTRVSASAADSTAARLQYLRGVRKELDVQLGLQEIVGKRLSYVDHWKDIEAMHLNHNPDPSNKNAYRDLTFWTEQFRDRCRRIQEFAKMRLSIDVDSIRRSSRVPVAPVEQGIKTKRTRESYRFVHWENEVTKRVIELMNAKLAEVPVLEDQERRAQ